jgi:hypothetical protein
MHEQQMKSVSVTSCDFVDRLWFGFTAAAALSLRG